MGCQERGSHTREARKKKKHQVMKAQSLPPHLGTRRDWEKKAFEKGNRVGAGLLIT